MLVQVSFESTKRKVDVPKLLVSGVIPAAGGQDRHGTGLELCWMYNFTIFHDVCTSVTMLTPVSFESTKLTLWHLISVMGGTLELLFLELTFVIFCRLLICLPIVSPLSPKL